MGSEILSGMGVRTNRAYIDGNFFKRILHGEFTDEQFFETLDEEEKKFEYAKANTILPEQCDFNKVEELVMTINERLLKK
jgi:hypothetical protein